MEPEPSEEQLRTALVSGLIAASTLVPIVATVAVLYGHRHPWTTPWGIASLTLIAGTVTAVSALIVLQSRRGHVTIPPLLVFAILAGSLASLMCVIVGAHASLAFYLPTVILIVFVAATIGDRAMRTGILAIAVVLVGLTGWEEGQRGWALVTLVAMYAWIGGALTAIVGRAVRQLVRMASRQRGVARIAEAIGDADAVVDGLRLALPRVGGALPTEHAVVLVRDEQGRATVVDAWPSGEVADGDLLERPELTECLARFTPVVGDGLCFVPAGYEGTAQYVMVARILRKAGDTKVHIAESAASLAAVFLRLTSRAAFTTSLQQQTRTDPLTGLPNRRGLLERLDAECGRSARSGDPLCLAMIDLDHFKRYNDTHGHVAGDHLLSAVTAALAATCRRQDLLVRYGGDELCLVLPETDVAGASEVASKLSAAAAAAAWPHAVTLSIGLTMWDGAEDPTTLIGRADQALYQAKHEGRDRVVVAGAGSGVPGPTACP